MAVPVRRNGLYDDDDDDGNDVGNLNALFEEEVLEELEPEEPDVPPYIRDLDDAAELDDIDAFRRALDNFPVNVTGVQLLLRRGANLEVKDADGNIALFYACKRGFTDIVRLILIRASDREQVKRVLDTVNPYGDTPLHLAAKGWNVDIFRLLLDYGASPTKINSQGKTPIESVTEHTYRRLMEAEVEAAAVARRC
ncbi:hypothetical protein L6164_033737 [Bauhinia variegata]|uniref:Uncharacterized protein n=1 Tax=Bauhinia variegata TaxID=167791 RepID=A0ACB9KSM7_BAUVA|nr:hypothetical protein L6164_033737 [Bauhinia variegata]